MNSAALPVRRSPHIVDVLIAEALPNSLRGELIAYEDGTPL